MCEDMARSAAVTSTTLSQDATTRARLIEAALLLFRRHGYHGIGVSEILALSGISKGSLYHHFPDGKQELGVEVVQHITERILEMFARSRSPTTELLLRRVGAKIARWMQSTGDGPLAVLASFAVESRGEPRLRLAVRAAYNELEQFLQGRLQADGFDAATAADRARLTIALFEGGGVLSQVHGQPRLFSLAIEHAARLCAPPAAGEDR